MQLFYNFIQNLSILCRSHIVYIETKMLYFVTPVAILKLNVVQMEMHIQGIL